MIYLFYLILAFLVIYLSNKASEYADLIDKKSTLSGAFIGGVILSAVTSLPELFTSLSSTILLNKPGLCIGNILGSDLFNLMMLACLLLFSYSAIKKVRIAKSHRMVILIIGLIYVTLLLRMSNILSFELFTISSTSISILLFYIWSIKHMSTDSSDGAIHEKAEVNDNNTSFTLNQTTWRFILVSIGIVLISILITYVADNIAIRHNLGVGMAGALFLGIATSLPEVSSSIALFRLKNYNIAIGNIVGSNIFNFLVLALVDLVYVGDNGVYDFSDYKTVNLLIFGAIATLLLLGMIIKRNKLTQIICPACMIICYLAFLFI